MNGTMYHMVLRTSALTLALVLLFESGLLSPVTARIAQNTEEYVATAIGMSAGVAPTELNQYTAQLTERDRVLTERESEIEAREIAVGIVESGAPDYSTYIISVLLFIILVLIVLNYALDYMRAREQLMLQRDEKMA